MKKKTKNAGRRLFSIFAAVLMTLTMMGGSLPVMAASKEPDPTYTVTITRAANDKAEHTYGAYQIFKGDLKENQDENGDVTSKILSNVEWGDNIPTDDTTKMDGLISGINTALNLTDTNLLANSADGATVAKAIADAKVGDDSVAAKALADIFGTAVSGDAQATSTMAADVNQITLQGLKAGYYLIKDENTVTGEGASTRYILEVVSNVNPIEKADVPKLTKKVEKASDDNEWVDAASYSVGDTINYKLTGTLPSDFADYKSFKTYTFVDTLSKGLTYNNKFSVKYYANDNDITGTDVTSLFKAEPLGNYSGTEDAYTNGRVLTVALADNQDLVQGYTPEGGNKILFSSNGRFELTYSATLNNNAVTTAGGNPNQAHLEFSNNPNSGHDTEKGTTPDDKVTVFTFQIKAKKVTANNASAAGLAGATFAVYSDATKSKEIGGGTSDENGTITFKKLDAKRNYTDEDLKVKAGTYYLVETNAPVGYNKAADTTVIITPTYDETSDDPRYTGITVSYTGGNVVENTAIAETDSSNDKALTGTVNGTIYDTPGSSLPSTGGMGTKLFYILGGAIVAGAVILLVVKRRKNA